MFAFWGKEILVQIVFFREEEEGKCKI